MAGKAAASLSLHETKEAKEELQEPVIPTVWSRRPSNNSDLICLHAYKIALLGDSEKYSNFALLLMSPLPEEAVSEITFQLRQRSAVSCKLEPLKDVFLDRVQVAQAEQFQSALFSVLLDHNLEHSQTKEQLMADGPWYLLLPLKRNQQPSFGQDLKIDWERITKLKSFRDSKIAITMAKSTSLKVDGTALQFFNGVLDIENVSGLLVNTIGKTLYRIIEISKDRDAESPFPNRLYKSYAEYFKSKHNHDIVHRGQRLLKARLLSDRSREDVNEHSAEARKSEKSIVELPPEICSIEYFGFYDDLVNAAVILPFLMHRIESILVAAQFRTFLGSKFFEGSLVSVQKVLEAITTQKCLEFFSLERLELLGDSFLKYAISCNLFLVHEEADEGFLTTRRSEKICNSKLFELGKTIGLMKYICDSSFDPKHWVAPCHPSEVLCDKKKVRDLHGESSNEFGGKSFVICNKRHRWMQRKTVADAVEALIGAYLEDGGKHAALAFIKFIGLEVHVNTSQIVKVQSLSESSLSLIKRFDIEAIEEQLSYSFRHKGLLIEAFTHASLKYHPGKCYQRLEFLGDSVLDFLITKHLHREFTDEKPGELTDLRSTIASNESFARIVVEKKLHCYLMYSSVELCKRIEEFVSYIDTSSQNGIPGQWDGDKCPKVLGDILESLSGAIFVDGGFDLSLVWKVFEPMLQPLILARKIQVHPVRMLLELCQQNYFSYRNGSSQKDDKQIQFNFKISVGNKVVDGVAISKDTESAKRQAAVDALAKLKALGYVHASSSDFMSHDAEGMYVRAIPENKSKQPLKMDDLKQATEKKTSPENSAANLAPRGRSNFKYLVIALVLITFISWLIGQPQEETGCLAASTSGTSGV